MDFWDPFNPDPGPGPTPPLYTPGVPLPGATGSEITPSYTLSGDGSGGGGSGGGTGPVNAPFPNASINYNLPGVPKFSYGNFTPPDAAAVYADPGYQFRLSQGEQALQQSAAGKGLLRSGGTLKDILNYGQNYASNEYENAYNRALSTFQTNYGIAKDEYAPQFAQWQVQAAAAQRAAELEYQRQWDQYLFGNVSATDQLNAIAGAAGG